MKYHIRLSSAGKELIDDYAQAYARLIIAPVESTEAVDAFVALQMRRKDLTAYISSLEKYSTISQEVCVIDVPDFKRLKA